MRVRLRGLFVLGFLAGWGWCAETVRLWPAADAFATSDLPDRNTGGWTYLAVTRWPSMPTPWYEQTLLQFDLAAIPPGSTVEQATLRLVCWDRVGAAECWCSSAAAAWAETLVTWNNRPGFDTFAQTHFGISTSPCTLDVDVRARVQAWVDGSPNHGFCLRTAETDSEYVVQFRSREAPDTTADPRLEVSYSLTGIEDGRRTAARTPTLRVEPNPARASAAVRLTLSPGGGRPTYIRVFNSAGICALTVPVAASTVSIPLSLAPGAYLVRYGTARAKLLVLP